MWDSGRLTNKDRTSHEQSLTEDLDVALTSHKADVVLLSECGEIEEGLIEKLWMPLVRKISGRSEAPEPLHEHRQAQHGPDRTHIDGSHGYMARPT